MTGLPYGEYVFLDGEQFLNELGIKKASCTHEPCTLCVVGVEDKQFDVVLMLAEAVLLSARFPFEAFDDLGLCCLVHFKNSL